MALTKVETFHVIHTLLDDDDGAVTAVPAVTGCVLHVMADWDQLEFERYTWIVRPETPVS